MSEIINNWAREKARADGVLAVCVRYADHNSFLWSNSDEFPPESLEGALRCVVDTFQVINAHRLPVQRLRWVYGNAFVHGVARKDGVCLGIIARRQPPTLDTARVEQILAEFETLRL